MTSGKFGLSATKHQRALVMASADSEGAPNLAKAVFFSRPGAGSGVADRVGVKEIRFTRRVAPRTRPKV